MNEILKPVPGFNSLEINHDGTIIYYNGKLKKINTYINSKGFKIKTVYIDNKRYTIGKLVYRTFWGPVPKFFKMLYYNNDCTDTHYLNIGPRHCPFPELCHVKKVPGYDELYINSNGTYVEQYGYERNIYLNTDTNNRTVPMVIVRTHNKFRSICIDTLVAKAYLNISGQRKIFHIDGNLCNNDYKNFDIYTNKEYGYLMIPNTRKVKPDYTKKIAIPPEDTELVKQRFLNGESLKAIANDYNCSDMAMVRFKKRHFTKKEIDQINKAKNINTQHTPDDIVKKVIKELKSGKRQIEVAKKYKLSPTIICRINRQHIKYQPAKV